MNTETLDKIYLEWSQFTNARTSREIAMEKALRWMIANPDAHSSHITMIATDALASIKDDRND